MLIHRLLTGGALIALLVGLAAADQAWPSADVLGLQWHSPAWWILAMAAAASGGIEFGSLSGGGRCATLAGVTGATGTVVAAMLWSAGRVEAAAGALGISLAVTSFLAIGSASVDRGARCVRAASQAAILLGIPLACWTTLAVSQGGAVVAAAILIVKSSDIGAYFAGRALGRTKLVPWLSPGKTWEGLVGGVALAVAAAWLASACGALHPARPIAMAAWVSWGLVAGIAGPAGDLTESLLKREAGMKDSGRILPGMGGVLDALDSLTITGPLALWMLA